MNDERGTMNGSSEGLPFETNETLRKTLHIAFGFFAFSLKFIPWRVAALVALGATIGNWLLLHRIVGRRVARHQRGYDAGIVVYPAAVFVLIVVFNWHVEIAAAAWALLAFGDGFATVVGRALPIAALPWNREKSWGGTLAFILFGAAGAFAVEWLFGAPAPLAIVAAVLASAIAESLPLRLNDNVVVPATAGGVLAVFGIQPLVPFAAEPP